VSSKNVTITFSEHGAELNSAALTNRELALLKNLAESALGRDSAVRLTGNRNLAEMLANNRSLDKIAKSQLGDKARPVRAVLFDKNVDANWALGWHQDRTIVVREKREVDGFGPWTKKTGLVHVEPPFEIIARMVTLRAHLDECDLDNGPLRIAPGSHRLGRLPADQTAKAAERLGNLTCLAEPGDVWLYATAIVHASDSARIPRHRRVLQVDYSGDDLPGSLHWLGV
jgi:hypothetical protein